MIRAAAGLSCCPPATPKDLSLLLKYSWGNNCPSASGLLYRHGGAARDLLLIIRSVASQFSSLLALFFAGMKAEILFPGLLVVLILFQAHVSSSYGIVLFLCFADQGLVCSEWEKQ